MANPRRPRDPSQLGKLIVDIATGESDERKGPIERDPAAVESGRRGGVKGGKARAAKLSPKRRSEIAKRAAEARWARS